MSLLDRQVKGVSLLALKLVVIPAVNYLLSCPAGLPGRGLGARVAGGGDQRGQIQRDQLGHGQQQPGHLGLGPFGQRGEVEQLGAGRGW